MGNTKSSFTPTELVSTIKGDHAALLEFEEIWGNLLDEDLIAKKYFNQLESSQTQFAVDDVKIGKYKRTRDKGTNIEGALALLDSTCNIHFKNEELRWLKKEANTISSRGPSASEALEAIRAEYLQRNFLPLVRSHRRVQLSLKKFNTHRKDDLLGKKAEYLLNIYDKADKAEGTMLQTLLERTSDLPPIHLTLSEEAMSLLEEIEAPPPKKSDEGSSQDHEAAEKEEKGKEKEKEKEKEQEVVEVTREEEADLRAKFKSSPVFLLLNHVFERAEKTMTDLANGKKMEGWVAKAGQEPSAPYSPSLLLLKRLQGYILRDAACASDNSPVQTLVLYSRLLVEKSISLLDAAIAANVVLSGHGENQHNVAPDVYNALNASPFNELLRHLVATLNLLADNPRFLSVAKELLVPLTKLTTKVDEFNGNLITTTVEEMNYLDRERLISSRSFPSVEVESPHKYYPDTDEEKVIRIPGATHLSVTFDPRCSTKDTADFLQLYRRPYKVDPILTKFSGQSANWPTVPVIVPGDTVAFHFHSNSFQTYWGYRCIVTGLIVEPCGTWTYDLERTLGRLTARFTSRLLVGPSLSPMEKKCEGWLTSPLFSGGREEDSLNAKPTTDNEKEEKEKAFLSNLVQDEQSDAAKLFATLNKTLPMSQTDMMGGPRVGEAIRYFIAANLKHMGLVEDAMDTERPKEKTDLLLNICKEGQKLRRWIIQESQNRQLVQDEKKSHKVKDDTPFNPNDKYNWCVDRVIAAMKLLLKLVPCLLTPALSATATSHSVNTVEGDDSEIEEANFISLMRKENQKREKFVNLRESEGPASSLNMWKSLFRTWQALQQSDGKKKGVSLSSSSNVTRKRRRESVLSSLPSFIVSFIQKGGENLTNLSSLIDRRVERAKLRADAFNSIYKLLTATKLTSMQHDLLRITGNAILQMGHYLMDTQSCGPVHTKTLQMSFVHMYSHFAKMLETSDTNASTKALVLRLWCYPFAVEDQQFLMHVKALPLVKKCMTIGFGDHSSSTQSDTSSSQRKGKGKETAHSSSEADLDKVGDRKLRQIGRLVYRHMAVACISEGGDGDQLGEFQQYGLDTLIADLQLSIDALLRKRKEYEEFTAGEHLPEGGGNIGDQIALNTDENIDAYQREEKHCHSILLSLYLSCLSNAGEGHLCSPDALRLQLQVLRDGTLRMQRLVLRMLRRILPRVSPSTFEDEKIRDMLVLDIPGCTEGAGKEKKVGEGQAFIYYLLAVIGEAMEIDIFPDEPLPEIELTEEEEHPTAVEEDVAVEKEEPEPPSKPKRPLSDSEYARMLQDEWDAESRPPPSAKKALPKTKPVVLPSNYRKRLKRWELKKKREMDTKQPSSQNYRDASVIFAEIAELVMLLRNMANNNNTADGSKNEYGEHWAKLLFGAITSSIGEIPSLVDVSSQSIKPSISKEDLWHALASLCIVGGFTDRVRVGGRVQTTNLEGTKEQGTVVFFDRISATVRVIFDSAPNNVIQCAADKLRALTEVPIMMDRFPLTAELTGACIVFAVAPIQGPATEMSPLRIKPKKETPKQQPKKEAPKPKPAPPPPKKEPWSCPACTYFNIPAARNCEICNTPNPEAFNTSSSASSAVTTHTKSSDSERTSFLEELLEEEEEEEIPVKADLLFHQLRSRALKFLCTSLTGNKESARLLFQQKLFPVLLEMAIVPTKLNEFQSLEQMEVKEDRLLELLYQNKFINNPRFKGTSGRGILMAEDWYYIRNQWTEANELRCSPLRLLKFQLPAALDRGTARNLAFYDVRTIIGRCPDIHSGGIAKANFAIPNSVPAYYFEIKILGTRNSRSSEPCKVALGLYRDGFALYGAPGTNSYAFETHTGSLYHNQDYPVHPDYGPKCSVGDVVGCGWSHRLGIVFFTKNGANLGPAFDNVNGRFLPAVWVSTNDCVVSVNFGQEPFLFDFEQVLPDNYIEELQSNAESTVGLTAIEIKRRTLAETLVSMTGVYPLQLCVLALEKCKDDIQFAANWLFENGAREMERMESEYLDRANQEEAERQERWERELLGHGGDVDPADIIALVEGEGSAQSKPDVVAPKDPSESRGEGGEEDSDSDFSEGEDGMEGSGGGGGEGEDDELFNSATRAEAGRYLDDEIGQDAPVQLAQAQQRVVEKETVNIDELCPGMLLRVSPSAAMNSHEGNWHPSMESVMGRTGVVTAVNKDLWRVELKFFDVDTCSKRSFWFSYQVLEKPTDMWQDPCVELSTSSPNQIKASLVEVETALAILKVRRAMLYLVSEWPSFPFDLDSPEGTKCVIDLLKLAGAEFLSSGASAGMEQLGSHPLLDAFRAKLTSLLKSEKVRPARLKLDYSKFSKRQRARIQENLSRSLKASTEGKGKEIVTEEEADGVTLTQILTKECIIHFIQAVEVPPPIIVEETDHPYKPNKDVRKKFHIPGASRLLIRFDDRSSINYSEMMTSVSFYRDEQHQDIIQRLQGQTQFNPIVVNSDRFWYRFTSGGGSTFWGVRFSVIPLVLRLNDREALDGLNFEFGYWLLELLLQDAKEAIVKNEYIIDLCEALMWYVKSSKRSAKMRGIQILIRVIQDIPSSPLHVQEKALRNLNKLMTLRHKMNRIFDLEKAKQSDMFSNYFQSLVELVCVTRLAISAINTQLKQAKEKQTVHDIQSKSNTTTKKGEGPPGRATLISSQEPQISAVELGTTKLQILSALYGVLPPSSSKVESKTVPPRCRDVTGEVQQFVNERGGSYLLIPCISNSLPFLTNDPAPGAKKSLRVKYTIFETASGILVDEGEKTASEGQSLEITSGGTWFDHVVGVADAAHSLTTDSVFSRSLLTQAARLDKFREAYYPLLTKPLVISTSDIGTAVADPGAFGNAFTVCLWIFLTEGHTGQRRVVFFKGCSSPQAEMTPSLFLNDGNRRLIFTCSTDRDSTESYSSKKELPMNEWTHMACWSDGKKLRIYVNGSLDGEHQISQDMRVHCNSSPFYIGRVPHDVFGRAINPSKGILMNARWYLRALDEKELKADMKSGAPKEKKARDATFKVSPLPRFAFGQLEEFLHGHNGQWSLSKDQQLVEMVCSAAGDVSPFDLPLEEIKPSKQQFARYNLLAGIPVSELRFRFSVIRLLNVQLANVLPLLDFSQSHIKWSLVRNLCRLKGLIFMKTKLSMWNKILQITTSGGGAPSVNINRPRAAKAAEKGDPDGSKSVFGQVFTVLHFQSPGFLRGPPGNHTWGVTYAGEGGTDAGGLFRDCISHICSDLMSNRTPLFIPCPNARGAFGDNQDKFIPNPAATSSLAISMFQFVGKLMGLAIRAKHILNLDLPSIVWKPLVGDEVEREDLEAVDGVVCQVLSRIANIEADGVTEETFADCVEVGNFVTTSSDGREIELCENGKNIPVTWSNRGEWVSLVYKYRLNEFKVQVEAIRKGMATVVPVQLLPLFTWRELELAVCGQREVDVDLLHRNTKLQGFKDKDKQIVWLWEMLREFSPKEKEAFLRFVWGRSRLPLTSEDFTQKMIVIDYGGTDTALPLSHTCFFQLDLPRYSSKENMVNKFLYAITEGLAIDTDHAADPVDWEAD